MESPLGVGGQFIELFQQGQLLGLQRVASRPEQIQRLSVPEEDGLLTFVDDELRAEVEVLNGVLPHQCLIVALILDDAGKTVLIEECMTGPECSLLCFVTAGQSFPMAPAQDHKRAYDGDLGPNTGGMGVYSPVPIVTDEEMAAMVAIMEKAAAATAREPFASDYRGTLYGGFMLTPEGPKIVEFNVRFGDPETQVVLPRLESDLVEVMLAVAEGRPEDVQLEWSDDWAVSVVLASEGYPGSYEKGKVILGIEEAEELPGVTVFHAGTRRNYDGELLTNGGRVLNVVAKGDSFEEARERAYEACDLINFEGKMYRHDIGKKALQGRSAWDQ